MLQNLVTAYFATRTDLSRFDQSAVSITAWFEIVDWFWRNPNHVTKPVTHYYIATRFSFLRHFICSKKLFSFVSYQYVGSSNSRNWTIVSNRNSFFLSQTIHLSAKEDPTFNIFILEKAISPQFHYRFSYLPFHNIPTIRRYYQFDQEKYQQVNEQLVSLHPRHVNIFIFSVSILDLIKWCAGQNEQPPIVISFTRFHARWFICSKHVECRMHVSYLSVYSKTWTFYHGWRRSSLVLG